MYTKQLTQPRKIRWRCVKRTTNCKAPLTTTLDHEDLTVLGHTEGFNVTRVMLSCSVVFLPCSNPPCGTYTKLRLRVSREPTISVKPGTTE